MVKVDIRQIDKQINRQDKNNMLPDHSIRGIKIYSQTTIAYLRAKWKGISSVLIVPSGSTRAHWKARVLMPLPVTLFSPIMPYEAHRSVPFLPTLKAPTLGPWLAVHIYNKMFFRKTDASGGIKVQIMTKNNTMYVLLSYPAPSQRAYNASEVRANFRWVGYCITI